MQLRRPKKIAARDNFRYRSSIIGAYSCNRKWIRKLRQCDLLKSSSENVSTVCSREMFFLSKNVGWHCHARHTAGPQKLSVKCENERLHFCCCLLSVSVPIFGVFLRVSMFPCVRKQNGIFTWNSKKNYSTATGVSIFLFFILSSKKISTFYIRNFWRLLVWCIGYFHSWFIESTLGVFPNWLRI